MTRLPFELMLALRYLRPKRTFVSAITLISIAGVMLGVAVLIIVISVMTGFDNQFRGKILGFSAHLRVEPYRGRLTDYKALVPTILSNRLVKGVAPFVMGQILLETQPEQGEPLTVAPLIRGIDPLQETQVSMFLQNVKLGTNDLRGYSMLMGRRLAESLRVRVGDHLAVYSIRQFHEWRSSRKAGVEQGPVAEDYTLRGIFDVGFYDFDSSYVISSLMNAQDLYGIESDVHGLNVALHDPEQAALARSELLAALGGEFNVTTWMEDNSAILDALIVEKNVMFYILFFITIVAAFGITSALITFVVQKTREIGMLKALGATSQQVMWIFLGQSLAVGTLGVSLGFGLGLLAVHYRNEFLFFMRRATGWELFPAKIYNFSELPALLQAPDIAVICGGSLVICLLAGVIPAWNASRLKPVEALRHE